MKWINKKFVLQISDLGSMNSWSNTRLKKIDPDKMKKKTFNEWKDQ